MRHGAYSVIIILYVVEFAESGVTKSFIIEGVMIVPSSYTTENDPVPPLTCKLPYSFHTTVVPNTSAEILDDWRVEPATSVDMI